MILSEIRILSVKALQDQLSCLHWEYVLKASEQSPSFRRKPNTTQMKIRKENLLQMFQVPPTDCHAQKGMKDRENLQLPLSAYYLSERIVNGSRICFMYN